MDIYLKLERPYNRRDENVRNYNREIGNSSRDMFRGRFTDDFMYNSFLGRHGRDYCKDDGKEISVSSDHIWDMSSESMQIVERTFNQWVRQEVSSRLGNVGNISTTNGNGQTGSNLQSGNSTVQFREWGNRFSQASQDLNMMGAGLIAPAAASLVVAPSATALLVTGMEVAGGMSAGADLAAAGCYYFDYRQSGNVESLNSAGRSVMLWSADLTLGRMGAIATEAGASRFIRNTWETLTGLAISNNDK